MKRAAEETTGFIIRRIDEGSEYLPSHEIFYELIEVGYDIFIIFSTLLIATLKTFTAFVVGLVGWIFHQRDNIFDYMKILWEKCAEMVEGFEPHASKGLEMIENQVTKVWKIAGDVLGDTYDAIAIRVTPLSETVIKFVTTGFDQAVKWYEENNKDGLIDNILIGVGTILAVMVIVGWITVCVLEARDKYQP